MSKGTKIFLIVGIIAIVGALIYYFVGLSDDESTPTERGTKAAVTQPNE